MSQRKEQAPVELVENVSLSQSEESNSESLDATLVTKVQNLLLEASVACTLQDALDEWTFASYQNASGTCICGREISQEYYLHNTENENTLCLGKDCLRALGDKVLFDTAMITRKTQLNKKKRVCACCLKSNIGALASANQIKCKTCYAEQKEVKQAYKNMYFRPCAECGDPAIAPYAPDWKKTCDECYAAKKAACRECKQCGEKRISPKESEYTKICYPCKLAGGKKACEGCGEFNVLAVEKWRKLCAACYKKSR